MAEVVPFDTIGQLINGLKSAYESGDVKGIVVSFVTPEGIVYFNAQGLSYIEKLGILQAGIDTVNTEAQMEE